MYNEKTTKRELKFFVTGCRWFDKINGNTYHSARIVRASDSKVLYCPFEYGYGEQYKETALLAMVKSGWIPEKDYRQYEMNNNYPILWNVKDGLKRDCLENGFDPNL
ncbi:MAG: hypothetical protein GY853_01610 [PVC group bacterium]|nr:hypothetical protein [PVC group bacterium]